MSGFANWFRYALLVQEVGMWVDTDVICLKPFDFQQRLVFGKQDVGMINNVVLGGQPGEPLFRIMARQAESLNRLLPYDGKKEKRIKWIRKYLQKKSEKQYQKRRDRSDRNYKSDSLFRVTGFRFALYRILPLSSQVLGRYF